MAIISRRIRLTGQLNAHKTEKSQNLNGRDKLEGSEVDKFIEKLPDDVY